MEVRKFVFALILVSLGLKGLLRLREGNSVFEVKHAVRRVRTVVAEDLTEGYFHPVAHFGDGKILNSVRLCGLVTAVVLRRELSNVLVGETELLSVLSVFNGSPKVFVDLHHTFAGVLIHLNALDVHAESIAQKSSEVVQKPGLRVGFGEFERQRHGDGGDDPSGGDDHNRDNSQVSSYPPFEPFEPRQVVVLGLFLHDAPGKLAFGTHVSTKA